MPIFILSLIIQVAFIVHIVKSGRNTMWIWIVLMLPLAGSIAYFVVEIFPEFSNGKTGRAAGRKLRDVVNPNRNINQAAENYSISDTVENSMRLAQECFNKGLYEDAKRLYEKSLSGMYANDPELLVGLANAEFMLEQYSSSKAHLDKVMESNPDYKNQDAHLLYARTLEQLNQVSAAFHEFEVLHSYYSGPEASYYYARFLKSQNQRENAQKILLAILDKASKSSRHYSVLHKDILRLTKSELQKN